MRLHFLLVCLISPFCSISQTDSLKDFGIHKTSEYQIYYPLSWKLDSSRLMGTEIFIYSPLEDINDKFSENINLLINYFGNYDLSLEEYATLNEKQILDIVTNAKILYSKTETKSNQKHHKIVYTGTQGKFNLKFEQYYWLKNGNVYILTFTSEEDKFHLYSKIAETSMNSFRLLID